MISLDTTSLLLHNAYRINRNTMNSAMLHVSSGKRLMEPGDDVRDYFHVQHFNSDLKGFSEVQYQLTYATGFVRAAEQLGELVYDTLGAMKDKLQEYYATSSSEEQFASTTEFNALKNKIALHINDGYFAGKKLVADGNGNPVVTALLDGRDYSLTYNIEYGATETVDPSGLTIGVTDYATESALLQAQIDKAGRYLGRTSGFIYALDGFANLTTKKIAAYQKTVEDKENINSGDEMARVTKASMGVQMTVSMMAQSNMVRSSVLNLVSALQS